MGENVALNGGGSVTGDLLVPGTPKVVLNGKPNYGGTLDASGNANPTNFQVTLNGGATLRNVVRRTDPVAIPSVDAPPSPTGTASVNVNAVGEAVNWATLRNLSLNSGVGPYAVPAGSYGSFTISGGSAVVLGTAGASTPSFYSFQSLTLNGNSQLQVVGPVILTVASEFTGNGGMGATAHPGWLTLRISSGGFTLNGGSQFYGNVVAPSGTVTVNGNSQLVGGVASDRLRVNGNGLLRLVAPEVANQSPVVTVTAPSDGATFVAPATFDLSANASDGDGTVAKVEFFLGTTKLGEDTGAPYSFALSGLAAGEYQFLARATDNDGAVADSTPVTVVVESPNLPPTITLLGPIDGDLLNAPATVVLIADVADADGTVAKVEFFDGTTKLGEVTAAPFQYSLTGLAAGTYALTARATDDEGAVTTSPAVTITVVNPNQPPVVSFTAPLDGTVLGSPASFTLAAAATDTDGFITKVEFFSEAVKLGEALSAPFEMAVSSLPPGTYTYLARATDNAGTSTDSAPTTVTVVISNRAPVALPQSVTTSENTAVAITLEGTDPDGDALTYTVSEMPDSGVLTGSAPNLIYTPDQNFHGQDELTFVVSDGALSSSAATVSISVLRNPQAPVITSEPPSLTIVLPSTRLNQTVSNFSPIELTPSAVGSGSNSIFTVLPTANPGLFGLTGTDVRKVNFDTLPDGTPLVNGARITNQYSSAGVLMNNIEVRSNVYGGPASQPFTTFTTGVARQEFVFTVPVVAVGVINTSPDRDVFEFFDVNGAQLFSTQDSATNPDTDRFVGARTNDGTLIGSMVLRNVGGDDELDELLFEVLTTQVFPGLFKYDVEATDPADLPLTYSLLGDAPASMSINPVTGLINWLPNGDDVGAHAVTVNATNTLGLFDSQSFTLEVIVNTKPAVSAGRNLAIQSVQDSVVLQGLAEDDGIPLSNSLVLEWSVVSGTGTVSFSDPSVAKPTANFSLPGLYVLKLSGSDGLEESADYMEVRVALPGIESLPEIAAWWPLNSLPHEVVHGTHDLVSSAGLDLVYAPGRVGDALVFDGVSSAASSSAHADLDIGASAAGFAIEFWVRPDRTSPPDYPLFAWHTGSTLGVNVWVDNFGQRPSLNIPDVAGGNRTLTMPSSLTDEQGNWVHLAYTYNRETGVARGYKNGQLAAEQNLGTGFTPRTNSNLWIGSRPDQKTFKGAIDEFTLYRRPLSSGEVLAIYDASGGGKIPPDDNLPPIVSAGPDVALATTAGVANLVGVVQDDGKPFGTPVITWTAITGPGTVTFADAASATTTATFNEAGTYLLKLSATDGYTLPVSDLMEVRVAVAASEPVTGLAAWWPANGHPREVVIGDHDVELLNGATYVSGKVSQAFYFDGSDDSGRVSAHADLDIGASAVGFAIEFWVRPDRTSPPDYPLFAWHTGSTLGVNVWVDNFGQRPSLNIPDVAGGNRTLTMPSSLTGEQGNWVHLAYTYNRETGVARGYKNGQLAAEQNLGTGFTPRTNSNLWIGSRPDQKTFKGAIDEFTLYRRALTGDEVAAIYAASGGGKSPPDDNLPPEVFAGADLIVPGTETTASLAGEVTDDNKPFGLPSIEWSVIDSPVGGTASFASPSSASTTATFSAPGTYLLKLTATDNYTAPVSDLVEVRVGVVTLELPADVAAWWPANGHPREVVVGDHDVELLNGATYVSGKVSQAFYFDGSDDSGRVSAHADLDIGASAVGFAIEFWVRPDRTSPPDYPLFAWHTGSTLGVNVWVDNFGQRPSLNIPDVAGGNRTLTMPSSLTGEQGNWVHLAYTYNRETGVARGYKNGQLAAEQNLGTGFTPRTNSNLWIGSRPDQKTFKGAIDEFTLYRRALTGDEVAAIHAASAGKTLLVSNSSPEVSFSGSTNAYVGVPFALAATASDDGLPDPPASLTYQWAVVSGPGSVVFANPVALETSATFGAVGTYLLRVSASDSLLVGSDDVEIVVTQPTSQPPSISITSPLNGASTLIGSPLNLEVAAADSDGTITKVEFFVGTVKLGEDLIAPYILTTTPTAAGNLAYTAVATDNTGVSTTSAVVNVTVVSDPGVNPDADLLSPLDGSRISNVTTLKGFVVSPILASWSLEQRLKVADGETPAPWIKFATGATEVGAPAVGGNPAVAGDLGNFDPTLLVNGIYEIRLTARDAAGRIVTVAPITVVVEGNLKIGAFSLAFEDLSVPVAGIPITLTRTYDSRDSRVGDFGPGWHLSLANIRVQKSRNLGSSWFQTLQEGSGFQLYFVEPVRERIVTVTMPDGETHRFRGGAYVKLRDGDPDNASFAIPADDGLYRFYPLGDTTATLEPLNAAGQLNDRFYIHGTGDQDLRVEDESDPFAETYNPTRFRLTTKDGTVFILDERLGLLELRDLSGNTLVLQRDAQNRVTSVVSQQAPPGVGLPPPAPTTITIHRNADGRVEYIRDPAGQDLDYTYDGQGRLTSFTDRELNSTQFEYSPLAAKFWLLTDIIDPRGITALRTEFDEAGRMVKQIDADGRETVFTRGIDTTGSFERIANRLGNATNFYYDDRGNVTAQVDALGGITTYTYDANDNQTSVTNPLGHTSTSTFDARKNLLSQSDPLGNTTTYTYNDLSLPLTITDARGKVTSQEYDANGNLTKMTDASGAVTEYTYDAAGRLTQSKDALNQTTTHTYGADGQIASTTNALGHTTAWTYDLNGNRLTQTVTRTRADGTTGNETTTYAYDAENRLTRTTFPDATYVETTYNSFGKQATSVDQLGRTTSFTYDDRGNLTRTDYPGSTFETITYDLEGRVLATTDRLGRRTTTTYDALGRTTRVTAADESFTQTAYDAAGRVTSTTDAMGHVTTFGYDSAGRRTSVKDALNQTTAYAYDAAGNLISSTDALNRTTGYTYDDRGLRTVVTFPDSTTQKTAYDVLGRRVSATDQDGKITRYRYDAMGRLVEVRQYLDATAASADADNSLSAAHASVLSTRYAYDQLGNQVSQTDALDRLTSYAYDALGRRVKRTLPDGALETYNYNAVGSLTSKTDFTGRTTTFAYDSQNRLTSKSADPAHPSLVYSHATARVEYDYDHNGARVGARTFNAGNLQLYAETTPRDVLSRVTEKATGLGTLGYEYYANGRLKDVVSSNSNGVNTGYRYDALNRLAFVDDASGAQPAGAPVRTTAYTYNAVGSMGTVIAANGTKHTYAYDSLNRLTSLVVSDLSALVLRSYAYTLNSAGHRSQIVESTGRTASYTYDGVHRLAGETISGDPAGHNGAVGYTLDKVGNRLARNSAIAPIPFASHSFGSRDWLASDTYDANGNTTVSLGVTTQDTYDFEDRLIIRRKPDGTTINLSYDADGIRRQKTIFDAASQIVGTTGYLVDTNNLTGYAQVLEEHRNIAAGITLIAYTYGSDLISQAVLQPAAIQSIHSYFVYDGMGSVRGLTEASGAIISSYDYDAFGILLNAAGTVTNSYLYRGEQFDLDLGQYYLRARFYNQVTGRFWNKDTYEGSTGDPVSLHKYLYANVDPVGSFDPSGHMTLSEVGFVGGMVGLTSAIALPQVRIAASNAMSGLYQAGVGIAGSIHTGALAAGTPLAEAWEKARAATLTLVTAEVLRRRRSARVLYHYTSAADAAAIALSGMMISSPTFSSVMHKGAYATDVEPWTITMTKKELSFGFYGPYSMGRDVSWFVAIEAPDFYSIGAPYDPRVSHWVRAASLPGEPIPVNVVTAGPNPMP